MRDRSVSEQLVDTVTRGLPAAVGSSAAAACVLLADFLAAVVPEGVLCSDRLASPGTSDGVRRLAVAAHRTDADDIHWQQLVHPGSVIWPVALLVGAEEQLTSAKVLAAACAGYEVVVRLAAALGPGHARHWHVTATAGAVGAAMTAGMLLGLDAAALVDAVGHAASAAGGVAQTMLDGSDTRLFHRGQAAATGLAAARAAGGLVGTREIFEGPAGVILAWGADGPVDALTRTEVTGMSETGIRPYRVHGFVQAAVHATSGLDLPPGAVSHLTAHVSGRAGSRADLVAAAVAEAALGDAGSADRVEVVVDPSLGAAQARVVAVRHDGTELDASAALGPATDPGIAAALARKWQTRLGADGQQAVVAACERLTQRPGTDVRTWLAELSQLTELTPVPENR